MRAPASFACDRYAPPEKATPSPQYHFPISLDQYLRRQREAESQRVRGRQQASSDPGRRAPPRSSQTESKPDWSGSSSTSFSYALRSLARQRFGLGQSHVRRPITLTSFFQPRGGWPILLVAASIFAILSSLRRQATSTVIYALRLQPELDARCHYFVGRTVSSLVPPPCIGFWAEPSTRTRRKLLDDRS
jgi:hypothetical protein